MNMEKIEEVKVLCGKLFEDQNELWELKVRYGSESNQIEFYEQVLAINDVSWIIEARLIDESQLDWLIEELKSPDYNSWNTENMFEDRKAINERYGFSNDHL